MSSTPCTKGTNSDPGTVCDIIRTCAASGVLELHLGDMSVFFTQGQRLIDGSRKRGAALDPIAPTNPFPETRSQAEVLQREEDRLRDDQLDELELTDPELAEQIALRNFEADYKTEQKLKLRRQIARPGLETLPEEIDD